MCLPTKPQTKTENTNNNNREVEVVNTQPSPMQKLTANPFGETKYKDEVLQTLKELLTESYLEGGLEPSIYDSDKMLRNKLAIREAYSGILTTIENKLLNVQQED